MLHLRFQHSCDQNTFSVNLTLYVQPGILQCADSGRQSSVHLYGFSKVSSGYVMVRFSSIEYELVAGYAKDAGYPISTFVRKQALSEKVTVNYNIVADIGEIQKLTAQAAGIGNNLNQIARYFHGGGLASRGMLEELKKCIAEIRELRQEIVQLGGVYRGNSKTHRK